MIGQSVLMKLEGTGAQRMDESGHPPLETPGLGFARGRPSKGLRQKTPNLAVQELILRVILQIEKCLTGAEAEEKKGTAESQAPTDPSSIGVDRISCVTPHETETATQTSGAGRQLSPSLSP